MRALATGSLVITALLLLATPAFSQPALAGIVKDASGAQVRVFDIDKPVQGLNNFTWDGKTNAGVPATAGTYTFEAVGSAAGETGSLDTLLTSRVASVPAGVELNLPADHLGDEDLVLERPDRHPGLVVQHPGQHPGHLGEHRRGVL